MAETLRDGTMVAMAPKVSHKLSTRPFWNMTTATATAVLESDVTRGLSEAEASARLETFGKNEVAYARGSTALRIMARQFKSPLILILTAAGTVTFFVEARFDAAIIFLAVVVDVLLGFFQEHKAETATAALRTYLSPRARVVRNGRERETNARDVVPGDLVRLTRGSRVPADARVLSSDNLQVDEAILTGESLPVAKHTGRVAADALLPERSSMVFGGSHVTEGSGAAIVTATGPHTEFGNIAALVSRTSHEQTPIERAVSNLAWISATGMSLLVAGIFVLGVVRGEALFDMFLVAVAVAVGAIPEALPVGLTAVLAVGMERLAKRKGIMQSLSAVETLGSTSIIMTDKTGTLTQANLELVDVLPQERLLAYASSLPDSGSHSDSLLPLSTEQVALLSLAVSGTDVLIENPVADPVEWEMRGSALEVGIVRAAIARGLAIPRHTIERTFRRALSFGSGHKFSVSEGALLPTVGTGGHSGHMRVALGAPEALIARSTLDAAARAALLSAVAAASRDGKRLVGVAVSQGHPSRHQPADGADGARHALALEEVRNLRFVGVLAFVDPVRPGVAEAIKRIEKHGVRVVMATGDLAGTARAVAKEIGWTVTDAQVCTGGDMLRLSDEELGAILDTIRIFARVTPEDKLRIARVFQHRGDIVAMTGDGVNDAPSLKAVDIGIVVGSGSDVAKGVADLVLLDDNFNTIVSAIEEGKSVLRNVRKTFVYLVSSSFDEVLLIGGSLVFGLALPLSALQIIWVNFFTESLPAIAFAFDSDARLVAGNGHTEKRILNNTVQFLTLGVGILSSVLLFVLYWSLTHFHFDAATAKTFVFACFGSYILCVAFSLRSLELPLWAYNPFSNRLLNFGVLLGLFLLGATVYVPFLQDIFKTTALSGWWLPALIAWVAFNILMVEGAKWMFYRARS